MRGSSPEAASRALKASSATSSRPSSCKSDCVEQLRIDRLQARQRQPSLQPLPRLKVASAEFEARPFPGVGRIDAANRVPEPVLNIGERCAADHGPAQRGQPRCKREPSLRASAPPSHRIMGLEQQRHTCRVGATGMGPVIAKAQSDFCTCALRARLRQAHGYLRQARSACTATSVSNSLEDRLMLSSRNQRAGAPATAAHRASRTHFVYLTLGTCESRRQRWSRDERCMRPPSCRLPENQLNHWGYLPRGGTPHRNENASRATR